MLIGPIVPMVSARFGSSKVRTAWKACGQSHPALFAGVLSGAGIDHTLPTLSAQRRVGVALAPGRVRRFHFTDQKREERNSCSESHQRGIKCETGT